MGKLHYIPAAGMHDCDDRPLRAGIFGDDDGVPSGLIAVVDQDGYARRLVERWNLVEESSCLAKLKEGEPFFVLRAQDILGPLIIEEWAEAARLSGTPPAKVQNALARAGAMAAWGREHGSKVPD